MGVKVSVLNSDGDHKGGLFKPHDYLAASTWPGRPRSDCTETLFDTTGPDATCTERSWYLVREAKDRELTGSEECDDLFDAASYALRLKPVEAAGWLREQGLSIPEDLQRLVSMAELSRSAATPVQPFPGHGEQDSPLPLPAALQEVWDLLEGQTLIAKEIAQKLPGTVTESAVMKRIKELNRRGRIVANTRGRGYYRPDAPPPERSGHSSESD